MTRDLQHVPFGYEPPVQTRKGTLVFYDTFAEISDMELNLALKTAVDRRFGKFVLYPLHEETVKRMMPKSGVSAYHKREKRLLLWKQEHNRSFTTIEAWEGKRKKYTPAEAAVRHLSEIYDAPLFLYVTPETAGLLASYSSFEEIISKVRLILSAAPDKVHPVLEKFRSRWEIYKKEL